MSTRRSFTCSALLGALLLAAPAAHAGSSFTTNSSGTLTTSVNLQFSITIPRFVFLRVGAAASTNTLAYSPTVTQIINSTGVLASGGDTGSGNSDVTVQVVSTAGNVRLTASTGNPNLTSGSNTIPWTTLTASSPTGSITAPPFNSGNTTLNAVAGIVNQSGSWRYTWTNPANTVYAAGTYTGTVTYTATSP